MNLTQLKQRIQDSLESTETTFVDNLDNFIRAAEDQILARVEILELRANRTSTFTADNEYLGLPSDYIAPYSIAVIEDGEHHFLDLKDETYMRAAYPSRAETGRPRFYGHFTSSAIIVAPTPDDAYDVELHYYRRPTSITTAPSGTTWLGTYAETALLAGALVEGYRFQKGDEDLMASLEKAFSDALNDLVTMGLARPRRDNYRKG